MVRSRLDSTVLIKNFGHELTFTHNLNRVGKGRRTKMCTCTVYVIVS